jgi:hypothetical protein
MEQYPKRDVQKALAAISSLKRAVGIPNHKLKPDQISNGTCHVYVPDQDSATLMAELLYRDATWPKGVAFYDSKPWPSLRDSLRLSPLAEGGFDVSIDVMDASALEKGVRRLLNKHISPDKTFTRGR